MACEELLRSDLAMRCAAAGVQCHHSSEGSALKVPFFDETITITIPGFAFRSSKAANVTLVSKIILLHYIVTASGETVGGDLIPYEDIPGLGHYFPVYERRVIKPLVTAFGFDRHIFLEAGLALGATRQDLGDVSFTLFALPRVPITFILWEGDDEFPPSIRTLFDPAIPGYLPLEDIVVISKLAATRLLKQARMQQGNEAAYDI